MTFMSIAHGLHNIYFLLNGLQSINKLILDCIKLHHRKATEPPSIPKKALPRNNSKVNPSKSWGQSNAFKSATALLSNRLTISSINLQSNIKSPRLPALPSYDIEKDQSFPFFPHFIVNHIAPNKTQNLMKPNPHTKP